MHDDDGGVGRVQRREEKPWWNCATKRGARVFERVVHHEVHGSRAPKLEQALNIRERLLGDSFDPGFLAERETRACPHDSAVDWLINVRIRDVMGTLVHSDEANIAPDSAASIAMLKAQTRRIT